MTVETVHVALGARAYDVHIGEGLLAHVQGQLGANLLQLVPDLGDDDQEWHRPE